MNPSINYYDILGVSETSSQEEIKKAYRKLAKENHPDSRGGDSNAEEQFKKIGEAYSILGDRNKRSQYDMMRKGGFSGAGGFNHGGPGSYQVHFGDGFPNNFEEIFGNLFGGFSGRRRTSQRNRGSGMNFDGLFGQTRPPGSRGADMEMSITIPFEMAINGGDTIIKTGSDKKIKLKIQPGTEDGKKIRIRRYGSPSSNGGEPGDLYLTIKVADHPEFERRGNDIHSHVTINIAEAILGTEINVKTIKGKNVRLKIPAGTSSAKTFRLPGMGIKTADGQRDHFVRVEIKVPPKLTLSQRREFKSWARKLGLIK